METNIVIVKPGELVLKSSYVKKKFEKQLIDNIKSKLKANNISYSKIDIALQRIMIYTDQTKEAIELLKKVFGISLMHSAIKVNADINEIKEKALEQSNLTSAQSFGVRSKRATKDFPLRSREINIEVGNYINEATNAKVNLTNLDVEVNIDIVGKDAFIFTDKVKALGGLPVGVSGKLLCLISDKNSFEAAKMMMKRGAKITCLNFGNSDEAEGLVKDLQEFSPFKIDLLVSDKMDKHVMFEEAEKIANKIKAKGIVTGSTKTNLKAQEGITIQIYSPLIGQ